MSRGSLTKEEKETFISFSEADKTAAVSTYNTRLRRKLEKLAAEHPDQIQKRGGGGSGPSEYTVPIACISIRPPYSEARKKADSERALRDGRRPPSGRGK